MQLHVLACEGPDPYAQADTGKDGRTLRLVTDRAADPPPPAPGP